MLYEAFFKKMTDTYEPGRVKDGLFAAMMDVALVNDGPVSSVRRHHSYLGTHFMRPRPIDIPLESYFDDDQN